MIKVSGQISIIYLIATNLHQHLLQSHKHNSTTHLRMSVSIGLSAGIAGQGEKGRHDRGHHAHEEGQEKLGVGAGEGMCDSYI